MLRAFANAPMALGAVIWSPHRTTLIAKAAFALRDDGTFDIEPTLAPLALDTFDPQGEIVYPTDFAPYKPACDVVVGGGDALERRTAGSLIVGTLACSVESTESLGPRESFCPSGDPSDPEVQATWMDGRMEFSRFQCAGPRQRMPWPEGALQIELARGPLSQRARWLGPWPSLVLEDPAGARRPIAMPLDTIVLFPSERRLIGVWRAIVDTPVPGEHRAFLHLPQLGREEVSTWSEIAVGLPSTLRARPVSSSPAVAHAAVEGTVIAAGHAPMAWPFASEMTAARDDASPPEPEPEPEQTQMATFRTPARTLPFRREDDPVRPSRPAPSDFGALRAEGRGQVRPAWDVRETTQSIQSVSAWAPGLVHSPPMEAPLAERDPPRLAEAPAMFPGASQGIQHRPPQAEVAAPGPLGAGPNRAARVNEPRPDDPSLQAAGPDGATVEAIRREIWKGERPLATVLAEHGMTEPQWRAALRKRAAKPGV